jgi:hypothetical protein
MQVQHLFISQIHATTRGEGSGIIACLSPSLEGEVIKASPIDEHIKAVTPGVRQALWVEPSVYKTEVSSPSETDQRPCLYCRVTRVLS